MSPTRKTCDSKIVQIKNSSIRKSATGKVYNTKKLKLENSAI